MATTTLNTRIKQKFDTWDNWQTNKNVVLLQGEIAVVQVPASKTAISGDTARPQYLIKIGDGTTTFENLPFAAATAADVYSWAKAATKPSYAWAEITGKPAATVNTNTTYQLVAVDGDAYQFKLQSHEIGVSTWTDVSTITIPQDVCATDSSSKLFIVGATAQDQHAETHSHNTAYVGADGKLYSGDKLVVTTDDSRLTNARTPVAHAHASSDVTSMSGYSVAGSATAVSTSDSLNAAIGKIEKRATDAMPKSGGTFTGTVTLNANPTSNLHAATKQYVDSTVAAGFAANDAMVFKGTIGTSGTVTALPTTGYSAGWTYRVVTAATYATYVCEVGDLIVCVKDYASGDSAAAVWSVVQSNLEVTDTITDGSQKVATANAVYDHVQSVVSGAVGALDSSVSATAASDNAYSVLTGVTEVDGKLTGKTEVTLAAVAKTGSYADLSNKATLSKADSGSGNVVTAISVSDHAITVTKGITALTSHQGIKTLNTTNTAAQSTAASEEISGSGTIQLHKIAKTANVNDLLQTSGDVMIFNCGSSSSVI